MTKIHIYYFSGTGNTAWVARRLAEQLNSLGNRVVATSCEEIAAADVDPAACDVLGIAFPVSASFAPPVFREFLQGLPPCPGKPLFAITSAGYAAGDTAWYAVKPLQVKGYEPFLLANVVVANNFYIPPMDFLPVTPPDKMPRQLEKAGHKIAHLADLIHRRERHIEGADPLGRLMGIGQRWGYDTFESHLLGTLFADETCTGCGWCARHCPVDNIEITEARVSFSDHCILCMRCYSFCPASAIQATDKTRDTAKYRRYQGPEGKPYPFQGTR